MLVFRDELSLEFARHPIFVAGEAQRLSHEALLGRLKRCPDDMVVNFFDRQNPKQAVEIDFERNGKRIERLFDPYTGRDLGNRLTLAFRFLLDSNALR